MFEQLQVTVDWGQLAEDFAELKRSGASVAAIAKGLPLGKYLKFTQVPSEQPVILDWVKKK